MRKMKIISKIIDSKYLTALSVGVLMSFPAIAYEGGEIILRGGFHNINPQSHNNAVVEVDNATSFTFNGTYMVDSHWGVELLAALPFSHDIDLNGGPRVASAKHLPPTLSLQYHFIPEGSIQPYVGLGVNWTLFFDEDTKGPLAGANLKLDDSVGLAAQIGVDIALNENWFINADVRYMDIETDAEVDGASIGTVQIDPLLAGISVGFKF